MPRQSYMNFPFPFYRNYYRPIQHPTNHLPTNSQNIEPITNYPPIINNSALNNNKNNSRTVEQKNKSNKYTDDYLFDLFGLKIYNDDVLLISLIYFLYSEGVKDDGLFVVLILLLLS